MAAANSIELAPVARSRHGAKLFNNPCPACGTPRLGERNALGKLCRKCACSAAALLRPLGLVHNPLYQLWRGMRARCEQPCSNIYAYYGGRGIKVCDEWRNDSRAFIVWAQTHGYAPGLVIDRKDSDGPYAPWNCQFITQLANTRKAKTVQCDEPRARAIKAALASGQSVKSIAAAHGFTYQLVWHIKNGDTWRGV